jgi:hypothetical protein
MLVILLGGEPYAAAALPKTSESAGAWNKRKCGLPEELP